MSKQCELHWWLVSYSYYTSTTNGCGNFTYGTNKNVFSHANHEYAKDRIGKNLGHVDFVLTSVSYLGEMTSEEALGENK